MWSVQIRANGVSFYGTVAEIEMVELPGVNVINLVTDTGDVWLRKENCEIREDGNYVRYATEDVAATFEYLGT